MGTDYTTKDVAKLAKLSEHRVRAIARAGLAGGEPTAMKLRRCRLRFGFNDVVLLRSVGRLLSQGLSLRRVERALASLKAQLEAHSPLSGVTLSVFAGKVVAQDGTMLWEPESGQYVMPWIDPSPPTKPEAESNVTCLPVVAAAESFVDVWQRDTREGAGSADQWFDLAIELEDTDPARAQEAYMHSLAIDPTHLESTINLGRLFAAAGEAERAAVYFARATHIDPCHPVANFNLAVILDTLNDGDGAIAAYRKAIAHSADFADAHHNLAMLLERRGDREGALHHFNACRRRGQTAYPPPPGEPNG